MTFDQWIALGADVRFEQWGANPEISCRLCGASLKMTSLEDADGLMISTQELHTRYHEDQEEHRLERRQRALEDTVKLKQELQPNDR